MVVMISYDLNGRERPEAYAKVKDMIERKAISFKKPLYSQWFVETNEGPDAWHNAMKGVADANDFWFVEQIRRPYQGWLAKDVWEWLNSRV